MFIINNKECEIVSEHYLAGFLLCEHTLMGVLIMTAIIGMVRSWLLVPQPLVVIEDVPIEKLASAYGINAVINALVTIVFGAVVGKIPKIIFNIVYNF